MLSINSQKPDSLGRVSCVDIESVGLIHEGPCLLFLLSTHPRSRLRQKMILLLSKKQSRMRFRFRDFVDKAACSPWAALIVPESK